MSLVACSSSHTLKKRAMSANKEVLVIGAGITGMTAALELVSNGYRVHVVEREDRPGGRAATFCCKAVADRCQKCNVCVAAEKTSEFEQSEDISLYLNAEIRDVTRPNGRFHVTVTRPPSCTDLAACSTDPTPLDREVQAIALEVDAVVVASGYEPYQAIHKGWFGYGRFDNVVTNLDVEESIQRVGKMVRPSDGKAPKRVAFIQCVGSRNVQEGNAYCSKICCTVAMRLSRMIGEQVPDGEICIFYMDIQGTRKGFQEFNRLCRDQEGVRFVRGIPAEITQEADGQLRVVYEDMTRQCKAKDLFDLVVLSVGISPQDDARMLAEQLGIALNTDGFCHTVADRPLETTGAGIFAAGTCRTPQDIAACIAEGVAVSSSVRLFFEEA
ncbi:MAG: FAD-dependent oxidoreductase [Candidatus Latescibacterota bacterium]